MKISFVVMRNVLIAQVDHAVRLSRDAVKTNRCVVIGLQSTGEARTLEQLEKDDGELSDFVSTAKGSNDVTLILRIVFITFRV